MLLVLHLQTPEGESKAISFYQPKFEDHIRLLNTFAGSHQIQAALVVEDCQKWSLPVRAFDGDPKDAAIIARLQRQWEAMLYT